MPYRVRTIEVHAIGSTVVFCVDDGTLEATVSQIAIKGDGHVEYQVVWWNSRTRTETWVQSHEIVAAESAAKRMAIGFSRRA